MVGKENKLENWEKEEKKEHIRGKKENTTGKIRKSTNEDERKKENERRNIGGENISNKENDKKKQEYWGQKKNTQHKNCSERRKNYERIGEKIEKIYLTRLKKYFFT